MNKRKIGLVELYDHSEVLLTLYRLLRVDYEVTVFTTQRIHQDAQHFFEKKLKNWITKPPQKTKEEFVKKYFAQFNNQDVLIFITLIDSFSFFSKIKFQPKTILVIHNVNTLLQAQKNRTLDSSSLKNYSMDVLRFLRNKIRRDEFYKKKLLQNFDYISFPSKQLTHYAKGLKTDFSEKIIAPLPFSFFEKKQKITRAEQPIIISVPGVILKHVRDYELLFEAISKSIPKLQKRIKLQLLGTANRKYGQSLIHKFQALENENFELIFFQKPLPQKDFDHFLEITDFVILPIKKFKKFGIVREEYGVSNITGGLNDVLRFGIPTLLIDHYSVDDIDAAIVTHFNSENDLTQLMEEWINFSKFNVIRKDAISILEQKNEESRRLELLEILNKILD